MAVNFELSNEKRRSGLERCYLCSSWKLAENFYKDTRTCLDCLSGKTKKTKSRTIRKCLACDKQFAAVRSNRLCTTCKSGPDWADGNDFPY